MKRRWEVSKDSGLLVPAQESIILPRSGARNYFPSTPFPLLRRRPRTVAGGGGGLSNFPNLPSGYLNSTELNFSQNLPAPPDNVDRQIGSTNWSAISFLDEVGAYNWVKTADPTAPMTPADIWRGHWAPGSFGGGVIGSGDGHGIGNIFTGAINGKNKLYASILCYFEFPDESYWHPISNKFFTLFSNNSTILIQLMEQGNWRHCEELNTIGGTSFFVDDGDDQPNEDHIPGQLDNSVVPINEWVQLELQIDMPGHVFRVWQNGVLTTDAAPTFASTAFTEFGIFAFRGGGGETLDADLYFRYDHLFLAWP